jgi:hypothetical protein
MICSWAVTELRAREAVTGWLVSGGRKVMQGRQFIGAIGWAVASFVTAVGGAHAQVTEADVGINPTFEQTDPMAVSSTGGFFSARAFITTQSDFDGGPRVMGVRDRPEPSLMFQPTSRWNSETPTVLFRTCKWPIRPAVTYST